MATIEFISGDRLLSGTKTYITVLHRNAAGAPANVAEGVDVTLTVRRQSNGHFGASNGSFHDNPATLTMTQIAAFPGVYQFALDPNVNASVGKSMLSEGVAEVPLPESYLLKATADTADAYQAINVSRSVPFGVAETPVSKATVFTGNGADVVKMSDVLSLLRLVHFGHQEIDDADKLQKFFPDGVEGDVGLKFELKDASGNKSAREVFKKVRQ